MWEVRERAEEERLGLKPKIKRWLSEDGYE